MKKICLLLVIVIIAGLSGCKKSTPAESTVQQDQPAAEQAASTVKEAAVDSQKAAEETAQTVTKEAAEVVKEAEAAKPAVEEAKEAMTTAAAEIDMTSSVDSLKEKAKQMSIDALKATAEKYKAQFLGTKTEMAAKTDQLSKLSMADKVGAKGQTLTKEIQSLTNLLGPLKDRMMVYVDALKAKGGDISSFSL